MKIFYILLFMPLYCNAASELYRELQEEYDSRTKPTIDPQHEFLGTIDLRKEINILYIVILKKGSLTKGAIIAKGDDSHCISMGGAEHTGAPPCYVNILVKDKKEICKLRMKVFKSFNNVDNDSQKLELQYTPMFQPLTESSLIACN